MTDLPAPLTDTSLDIGGIPGFILDVVVLQQSELAAGGSGDEFKAAVLLWCKAWQQKPVGSLPDDDRVLAGFAGYGRDVKAWLRVRERALDSFIKCSDGRWYHPMLAKDAKRAHKNRQQKKDAANQRWSSSGSNPDGPTGGDAPHDAPHDQRTTARNAGAMPVQSSTSPDQSKNLKNQSLGSGSGGSASPRPGKLAGPVGIDWSAIVTRMTSHGYSAETAWTLLAEIGDRPDIGRRLQGAMRAAEERNQQAFYSLSTIVKEALAERKSA